MKLKSDFLSYFFFRFLPLCLLFYYAGSKWCIPKTDGFEINNIYSSLSFNPKWQVADKIKDDPWLHTILNQKFHYLGHGGQCYAFASEDGRYVLKFFKHHLRRVPWLFSNLPLPSNLEYLREKKRNKRENKLIRDFSSYKLCFEKLPEETGLIFVHLNKTIGRLPSVLIADKLNIEHRIALDEVEFVIQKKATLAYTYIDQLMQANRIEEAKKGVASICDLIVKRSQKGIFDEDAKIHRNFGFVNDQAIVVDVGRLKIDLSRQEPQIYHQDLSLITKRFKNWLMVQRYYPLVDHLEEYLHGL